jgi:phosphoglycolate phosphatase-like HAD superfamily hydrolase
MRAVLWDLDSTLADTRQRQPMVAAIRESGNTGPTWVDYSMACEQDAPVAGAVALVRLLHGQLLQYGVSGRNLSAELITRKWLHRYRVPLDDVFLRADDAYTPNGEFKVSVITKLRAADIEVVLLVDDWRETAEYVSKETGVPVLLVKGDYLGDAEGNV